MRSWWVKSQASLDESCHKHPLWVSYGTFATHPSTCCVAHSYVFHIWMRDTTHSYGWHYPVIRDVTLVVPLKCDMTHSGVGHDSFICVTWLIHMCDMTYSSVRTTVTIVVPLMCDMAHSYMWRDTLCSPYVCHDSFIYVMRAMTLNVPLVCDMTYSHVGHNSVLGDVTWYWHPWRAMSHMNDLYVTWINHVIDYHSCHASLMW